MWRRKFNTRKIKKPNKTQLKLNSSELGLEIEKIKELISGLHEEIKDIENFEIHVRSRISKIDNKLISLDAIINEIKSDKRNYVGKFIGLFGGKLSLASEREIERLLSERDNLFRAERVPLQEKASDAKMRFWSSKRRMEDLKENLAIYNGLVANAARVDKTQEKERKKKKEIEEKIEKLSAAAQSSNANIREAGGYVRRRLAKDHPCPYCGDALGSNFHADHIHPVAKGGKSTTKNMVFVCVSCNLKKKDLTLNQFIDLFSLDRDRIFTQLRSLGKDY